MKTFEELHSFLTHTILIPGMILEFEDYINYQGQDVKKIIIGHATPFNKPQTTKNENNWKELNIRVRLYAYIPIGEDKKNSNPNSI